MAAIASIFGSINGQNGIPGNHWYVGSGAPNIPAALPGDCYLDTSTWDVWVLS